MRNTAILLVLTLVITSMPAPLFPLSLTAWAGPMVCVNDLDGDGYAGEGGEADYCNSNRSETSFYCPIEAVQCTKEEEILTRPSVTVCPDNYTLNAEQTLCTRTGYEETEPGNACPAGYVYNSTKQLCEKEVTVTEPYVATCPSGYALNSSKDACVKYSYQETDPSYSCPSGYEYVSSIGNCRKRATAQVDPYYYCPSGSTYRDGGCYEEVSGSQCGVDDKIPMVCELSIYYRITSGGAGGVSYYYYWHWGSSSQPISSGYMYQGMPTKKIGDYYYAPGDRYQSGVGTELCRCPETAEVKIGSSYPQCSNGYTYNSSSEMCEKSTVDYRLPTINCPSGYSYNSSSRECTKEVVTTISVSPECPSGYTYNGHIEQCESQETVSTNPTKTCPSGFSYVPSENICEKETVESIAVSHECDQTGYTYNPSSERCEKSRLYDACPLTGGGVCVTDSSNGRPYCSPNPCFDRDDEVSIDDIDGTMLVDDGERDQNGACLDEVMIFNGRASECLKSGVSTAFKNCCDQEDVQQDSMGSASEMKYAAATVKNIYQVTTAAGSAYTAAVGSGAGQAAAAEAATSAAGAEIQALMNPATIAWAVAIYFIMDYLLAACPTMSIETSMAAGSGLCHEVGTYCKKKWLGSCVQKAVSYCCFNSKMGRIIHEEGRAQLKSFGDWGSTQDPICRGFSPEEFRALDFSRIDMSEYYEDLMHKTQGEMKTNIMDKTGEYFDAIK